MIEAARASGGWTPPRRQLLIAVTAAALVGIAGGVALHRLHSARAPVAFALPELHGQAAWAPGARPAPAFALRDQRGAVVSLVALRGRPVLLAFLAAQCTGCAPEAVRIASVLRRLPAAQRPALVVVSLDPRRDTPAAVARAVRQWGLGGGWPWHWLSAAQTRATGGRLARVWHAYGVAPGSAQRLRIVLIDRRGDERTAYLFPFLPAFVEGDLTRLAGEHA
jgi:cytochrome oxidase Cu insertion factor (SCO1/SenC/PrrC family)